MVFEKSILVVRLECVTLHLTQVIFSKVGKH